MARNKAGKGKVKVILEDDDDEDLDFTGIKGGEVERYEVRVEPPIISGRKAKVVRSPEDQAVIVEGGSSQSMGSGGGKGGGPRMQMQAGGSSQQVYKIEDDLRKTRDVVEDLRHTVDVMEVDFKDLKAEMDRISYLLRSLEGLKNTMKDIESTVSELSGLYDMISANVNPFIDIEPFRPSNGNGLNHDRIIDQGGVVHEGRGSGETTFSELSDIFTDDDEEDAIKEMSPVKAFDLRSEEWALRWTQFLIDKVGKEGLEMTLDYYRDLGWIDEGIIDKVMDISRGTVGPPRKREEGKVRWRMNAEDHVKTLEFIRNIRGK